MEVLFAGAGVVGTVYGSQLAAAGLAGHAAETAHLRELLA